MTEISRPWQSTSPGDAGPYSAANWQALYQNIIGLGASRANVGVFLGSGTQPNDGLKVQAQGVPTASIDVLSGAALVQGIAYISTATVSFVIAANASGSARIDTVVLQADYALQTVRLAVLQGTPAGSPVAPTLTQSANILWEIPLADIAVANGFATITNANITPRHEWANAASGVYLDNVLNNSGGTLEEGDVVIWDLTADRAVTTTTTADNIRTAGVWVGRTANAGYGRVLRLGIGLVNTSGAVTRGNLLNSTTVAKQAAQVTTPAINSVIGRALETTSGAGLALTFVHVHVVTNVAIVHFQDQKANTTAPASIASGAWRTREINTEVTDTAGIASVASNQMTLPAGSYEVWASAPSSAATSNNRIRLRDTTGGVTLVQGTNGSNPNANAITLSLHGFFTLTTSSALELQHYTSSTGNGGIAVSSGEVEVYASVYFRRLGEAA